MGLCDILILVEGEARQDELGVVAKPKKPTSPKAEAAPPLPATTSASKSLQEAQRKKLLESAPIVEIDQIEVARFEAAKRTAAEAVLRRKG